MGGQAGGLQSILPLLLLSNSSALNTSDTLTMILLLSGSMSGAAPGGVGGAPNMNMLLPLLLGGSMNDTKDLLLIMMLGGMGGAPGAGGMESLLPLLLLGRRIDERHQGPPTHHDARRHG